MAVKTRRQTQPYSHWKPGFVVCSSSSYCAPGAGSRDRAARWHQGGVEENVDIKQWRSSSFFLCDHVSFPRYAFLSIPTAVGVWVPSGEWVTSVCCFWSKNQRLFVFAVMNDIITTMFNKKFMEELFKPQELYSKKALRTVYDRLAHASIMRLNQASMDKVKETTHLPGPACWASCSPSWGSDCDN